MFAGIAFSLLLFVIVLCIIIGLVLMVKGFAESQDPTQTAVVRLAKFRQRLDTRTLSPAERARERDFVRSEEQRANTDRATALPGVSKALSSYNLIAQMEEDLIQVKSPWRAPELFAASIFLSLVVFIAVALLLGPFLAFLLGIACLFLPWGYIKYQRAKLYRMFEEQLADTLLLMANSLKAGFSFLQSMEMVGRESQPPIADEFGRVVQEISLGVPVSQALHNLTVRIRSMDLNLMVTAVIIQREVGGGLAEILETIAEVLRERMRIKREIRVLTTQGRVSGIILALLPVGIGFMIHLASKAADPGAPSFIQPLLTDPRGHIMLGMAAVMELIGFFAIMRIVSIRV